MQMSQKSFFFEIALNSKTFNDLAIQFSANLVLPEEKDSLVFHNNWIKIRQFFAASF